ncbi:MAG: heavy metal translocating P-type ATPase [Candidatus Nanopelagicales bacterium]|nr:heavy metal translocating P-type ATPase [Candidatus Nanopelagicales bacterium]
MSVVEEIDLPVIGMTCTACARHIENRLNSLPGVQASVNYATESAHVAMPPGTTVDVLVEAVRAAGYDAVAPDSGVSIEEAAAAEVRATRLHFWVSLAFAIPVSLLSMIAALQFTGWQWVVLALAVPVVTWGAWPFHRATWLNLRHGTATMDTLISMGVTAAFLWSAWAVLLGGAGSLDYHGAHGLGSMGDAMELPALYFEVAAAVPVFVLAGRWFEARAKRRSSSAIRALLTLQIADATVLVDGVEQLVPLARLRVGDHFIARPGERIATDGEVVAGESAVDEALLTGESVPIAVAPGSRVVGATINLDGRLEVRATGVGADTRIAQIAQLVTAAQSGKAPIQRLADRVSAVFVPAVLAAALLTLALWLVTGHPAQQAFSAAVAVLIIACPCALGLATPIALLVGTGRGAQLGIVIRGPETLEQSRRVTTVLLDKTGTVTTGQVQVRQVLPAPGLNTGAVLDAAGPIEAYSEHPLARAIAGQPHVQAQVSEFRSHPGRGAQGQVDGRAIVVGSPSWVIEHATSPGVDDWFAPAVQQAQREGLAQVGVSRDGRIIGLITLADSVRGSSAQAVRALVDMGIEPILLTGDSAIVGRVVADEVGIAQVIAEVRPEGKVAMVQEHQAAGRVVAMVGDGVNDAAALVQADLGIAMSAGSDVAIEASDITLVRNDLLAAVDALRLSRRTLRTIRGNLFWAFAYNVAMIPLAAIGLLSPLLAGAAMAFSSVFVVANSLRLRRFQPIAPVRS